MQMIKIIQANTNWWKKYYKVTEPSIESKEEFDTINEQGRYNLTLIADLEAKAKYSNELGNNALDYGWLVEEKGNIYPAMSVGDRIIPIDLSEVQDCCEEDDYSGYPSFMLEESNKNGNKQIEKLKNIIRKIGISGLKEQYPDPYDYLSKFISTEVQGLSKKEIKDIGDELWSWILETGRWK